MHIITVATGAILDIRETEKRAGMVDTNYDGRTVEVFVEDLKQRAEPADDAENTIETSEPHR
ncbi:MAG TPA: hypothetical protein VFW44_10465 [Bryobacteraceae bacterium]|nr:hypothetical protein [Bryobacteraceae bacterium]